ncbi:MAG: hypothetical protein GY934_23650, partial [Gammaproteobacteria bacterium]|nr:hypothetical protein [Gammaproteobacteria bacterium]
MSNLLTNRHFHTVLFSILLLCTAVASQAQHLPDFTGMVEQNSPAVVNISTKQKKSVKRRF